MKTCLKCKMASAIYTEANSSHLEALADLHTHTHSCTNVSSEKMSPDIPVDIFATILSEKKKLFLYCSTKMSQTVCVFLQRELKGANKGGIKKCCVGGGAKVYDEGICSV